MTLNDQIQDLFIRSIWLIGGGIDSEGRAIIASAFYRGTIDNKGGLNTHGGTLEDSPMKIFSVGANLINSELGLITEADYMKRKILDICAPRSPTSDGIIEVAKGYDLASKLIHVANLNRLRPPPLFIVGPEGAKKYAKRFLRWVNPRIVFGSEAHQTRYFGVGTEGLQSRTDSFKAYFPITNSQTL